MAHDPTQIEQLARTYTEAWCSRDPARVAGHYGPGGMIAINGGDATGITEVAEAFIAAFPDIEVFMDDLVLRHRRVPLDVHRDERRDRQERARSRLRGVDDRPGRADRRVTRSLRHGHYDQAEYDRQLQHGIGPAT
jgi:hypothetical protein